jgi:hypothetical protein
MERRSSAQFTIDVSVYHDSGFRKSIVCSYLGRRNGWIPAGEWHWTGLGVPADLVDDCVSRVAAVITEHLVTRYGVQGMLDTTWAGEAGDP